MGSNDDAGKPSANGFESEGAEAFQLEILGVYCYKGHAKWITRCTCDEDRPPNNSLREPENAEHGHPAEHRRRRRS